MMASAHIVLFASAGAWVAPGPRRPPLVLRGASRPRPPLLSVSAGLVADDDPQTQSGGLIRSDLAAVEACAPAERAAGALEGDVVASPVQVDAVVDPPVVG